MKMSDPNEEIWLTYEGILSEVEDEYKAKFDVTEKVKQWAVACRMYQAGRRYATQELIEKALGSDADNYKSYDGYVAEWLKSQIAEVSDG
jgi:Zn-dependent M32 family carboxypeptidase